MQLTVEEIEDVIAKLPEDKLKKFRDWYEKFDADKWDRQIGADAGNGKLDILADAALADHKAGKSRTL